MANEEHLRILKQGIDAWNSWRRLCPSVRPDLLGADLRGADLTGADLIRANLGGADLSEANLIKANLSRADLSGADLEVARFGRADLRRANLSGANLAGADLSGAILTDGNLSDCVVGYTVFADVDLSRVRGLDTVEHWFPSSIDIATIYRSNANIPSIFLRGAGVPEQFIQRLHLLIEEATQFYSCFISYSHHDQTFCERIHADLQTHGVRVWYFPEDAAWGQTVWGEIDRGIRSYDKLVVVCSENSLQSGPVLREIERALQREDREATQVLFPIRVDDYIFKRWQHERSADVIAKVVGDFTGCDEDPAKYEASFRKLMKALQPEADAEKPQDALASG